MRTILLTVALLTIFYSCISAFQIDLNSPSLGYKLDSIDDSQRVKRQLESFDEEYPTASSQNEGEEPGFWDRIVKVALKLFSRFIEWLNAS